MARFRFGPIPEDPEFHPEEEDWRPLKEPSPGIMQLMAVPIALIVVLGLAVAWGNVAPFSIVVRDLASFGAVLLTLVVMIPVHEAIHALCHPHHGRSSATWLGFWPAKGLFYAFYDAEMSRGRSLLIGAAPFLVLSVLPLAVCAILAQAPGLVVLASLWNGLGASGDILGLILVGLQVPAGSVLRNRGWRTWWRPA